MSLRKDVRDSSNKDHLISDSDSQGRCKNANVANKVPTDKEHQGRYGSRGRDRHPNIPLSQVLLFPSQRPGRFQKRKSMDIEANKSFGDAIIYKEPTSTRFFFQNVKGMTFTRGCEDYRYFLSAMMSYSIDFYGWPRQTLVGSTITYKPTFDRVSRDNSNAGKLFLDTCQRRLIPYQSKKHSKREATYKLFEDNLLLQFSAHRLQIRAD